MRRSSIITILALLLVIILLTAALILTNLPKKDDVQENNVNVEQTVVNNEPVEEKGTPVSLNDEKVDKMSIFLNILRKAYYNKTSMTVTAADLEYNDIGYAATYMEDIFSSNRIDNASGVSQVEALTVTRKGETTENLQIKGNVSKDEVENAVKKWFGKDVDFKNTTISSIFTPVLIYNKNGDNYGYPVGVGGGGMPYLPIHGITEVTEYSDRYEVKEKYIFVDQSDVSMIYVYSGNSYLSTRLVTLVQPNLQNTNLYDYYQTPEQAVQGVVEKPMHIAKNYFEQYSKLLSKYYDEASEYVHTFMKNDDGSYYWLKTEKVK